MFHVEPTTKFIYSHLKQFVFFSEDIHYIYYIFLVKPIHTNSNFIYYNCTAPRLFSINTALVELLMIYWNLSPDCTSEVSLKQIRSFWIICHITSSTSESGVFCSLPELWKLMLKLQWFTYFHIYSQA